MESKTKLFKALADFQQEVPAIYEGSTGYGYKYADLKQILAVINPILKKHKLGFTQLLNNSSLETIVFHTESGENISSSVEIPQEVTLKGMNAFQVLGSAITYYRRYSLSSILGLVTDSDNDASAPKAKQPVKVAPVKKAVAKVAPVKKAVVKLWITDEIFEKCKALNEKQLEKVFDKYQFRKEEQEEELQELYNQLKSNN
tara:strand:+ start:125 stop:727 length:603 start_codon:yes stop_codon:yes gene_type:complete